MRTEGGRRQSQAHLGIKAIRAMLGAVVQRKIQSCIKRMPSAPETNELFKSITNDSLQLSGELSVSGV